MYICLAGSGIQPFERPGDAGRLHYKKGKIVLSGSLNRNTLLDISARGRITEKGGGFSIDMKLCDKFLEGSWQVR